MKLGGPALYGTYGVADFVENSSDAAVDYSENDRNKTNIQPDCQSSWNYRAVKVLAMAINKVGKTEPQAIRDARLAVRGYQGADGTYNFDKNGGGLHGYNVVKNENGTIVFDKHVDFYQPN
jgi:branched-chain amino acid transport system substrate-binding protein